MTSQPYFQITPDGAISMMPSPPPNLGHVDHTKKPIQIFARRDPLGLEIRGENFRAVVNLTADDALGIIFMLAYGARESFYTPTTFVQAAP
jgi:hypothetical protein